MGFFDSGSIWPRVGMGSAAVAAVGLLAGGLWWDQARVNDVLEQATTATEEASVEPRATSDDDETPTTTEPTPEPSEDEATEEVEEEPAPEPEVPDEPPVQQAPPVTSVPSAPAQPVAPVQQPVQQAPANPAPVQPAPANPNPNPNPAPVQEAPTEQDGGTTTEGDQSQTETPDEQPPGAGGQDGQSPDAYGPENEVTGGDGALNQAPPVMDGGEIIGQLIRGFVR